MYYQTTKDCEQHTPLTFHTSVLIETCACVMLTTIFLNMEHEESTFQWSSCKKLLLLELSIVDQKK